MSAQGLVSYLNECWTPFHATQHSVKLLRKEGFLPLSEREPWSLEPNGKYGSAHSLLHFSL